MTARTIPTWRKYKALPVLAVLGVVELVLVSLLYKNALDFTCDRFAPVFVCAGLSGAVVRAMCALGVVALALLAQRDLAARLLAGMRTDLSARWLAVQIAGFACVVLPWTYLGPASQTPQVAASFALWGLGAVLAITGMLNAALDRDGWRAIRVLMTPVFGTAIVIALLAPEIAKAAEALWTFDPISYATYTATEAVLRLMGQEVYGEPEIDLLAVSDFAVLVGKQCSGMEGFALITGFLLFYFTLFRDELRFSRVWFLIPVGLMISWVFNIVRIVVLLLIGAHISPELAAGGFHSHAGWLLFTLLSLGMVVTVNNISWFRKEPSAVAVARTPLPFWSDLTTAMIFPFIVFMLGGLLAQTLFTVPDLVYPFRMGFVALVTVLFWPALKALERRISPLSILAGAVIGVGWILVAPDASDDSLVLKAAVDRLAPALMVGWIVCRVLGSSLVVPVVEELFFRGYLFRLMDRDGMPWRILALVVSSALFGALHGRWWEATIAGVVYALLMVRTGRVADAIAAHATSNVIIAGSAAATGAWWII